MVSIIRLHYPNHECDDEMIMLDIPFSVCAKEAVVKAEKILSRPLSEEEMLDDLDYLEVLDDRLDEIEQATGCVARTMYSDANVDAGF